MRNTSASPPLTAATLLLLLLLSALLLSLKRIDVQQNDGGSHVTTKPTIRSTGKGTTKRTRKITTTISTSRESESATNYSNVRDRSMNTANHANLSNATRAIERRTWGNFHPFKIALWGDIPYMGDTSDVFLNGPKDNYGAIYGKLRDSINAYRSELIFNIHAGDVKSGSTRCDSKQYRRFEDLINSLDAPGFLTLGDNDWTDCHRSNNGNYDPLERLAYVRSRFFNGRSSSFGSKFSGVPIKTETYNVQYPELQRWTYNNVLFVTLHIVGSNNGLYDGVDGYCDLHHQEIDPYCIQAFEEASDRSRANLEFLQEAFDIASETRMAGVFIAIHANPFRCDTTSGSQECLQKENKKNPTFYIPTGFQSFYDMLVAEANYFNKPVVLFHGDFHYFRIYPNPGGYAPQLVTVQCPGDENIGWVLCEVNPNNRKVFSFKHIPIHP